MTVKSHNTEMWQWEQIMRGKEHWPPKCIVHPPFSLFTCLATAQQRLVTSPREPRVVSLHENAGHFSTMARRVISPSWCPPPPCKQALHNNMRSFIFEIISETRNEVQGNDYIFIFWHITEFWHMRFLPPHPLILPTTASLATSLCENQGCNL